jgi:FtsP/CotA-like multicopper oxidase with cupredoxin domain
MNYTAQQEHAMMHEPLFRLRRGEHVTLKMMNNTDYEHPMHLHGHFFRVLRLNDVNTRLREWRDTVMIDPRGSVDIAFVAENVGEWPRYSTTKVPSTPISAWLPRWQWTR